jgi:hypothetical protein
MSFDIFNVVEIEWKEGFLEHLQESAKPPPKTQFWEKKEK